MYRHSVHVQPQQDSSSNSPAAWDAGRNQGLTSDTASSDQFGSGRGSGGPTAGEQVQGGAQRIKESAQDFANPNSGLPEHSACCPSDGVRAASWGGLAEFAGASL